MSDRLKLPPYRDTGFYQRRKHDAWREVPAPDLGAVVADTHCHLHMLDDPVWELVRCAANGVVFLNMIVDPSEDGIGPLRCADVWLSECAEQGVEPPHMRITCGVHPHNARLYTG